MATGWEVTGTEVAKPSGGWDVVNHAPVVPAPDAAVRAQATQKDNEMAGDLGILGTGIANVPHAAVHAVKDLVSRITGNGPSADTGGFPLSDNGEARIAQLVKTPLAQGVKTAVQGADSALGNYSPTLQDVAHQTVGVAGDVGNLLPIGGAGKLITKLFSEGAEGAGATVLRNGYRTQTAHPFAAGVAGTEGRDALTVHNQEVTNTAGRSASGVSHTDPLNYDTLEAGRDVPNAVYARTAQSLPEGPLSPAAAKGIQDAGTAGDRITDGTPDALKNINALKQRLLDPNSSFSGERIVNELRGLRQEGYKNIGSEDVSNQQLGKAQLQMAQALEQHISDTLPPGSSVSLEQLQGARTALAKNQAVQAAMRGEHMDAGAIARIQRAEPNLLSGELQDVASFANRNPLVSGLASRVYNPPGFASDIGGALGSPHSVISPSTITGLLGARTLARNVLMGDTESALKDARTAFPGRHDAALAALPPSDFHLQQPLGNAFTAHQPGLDLKQPLAPPPGPPSILTPPPGPSSSLAPPPRPSLTLEHPPGQAFDAHQHGLDLSQPLAPPRPSLNLESPPGQAFDAHQPNMLSGVDELPPPRPGLALSSSLGDAFTPGQKDLFTHGVTPAIEKELKKKLGDLLSGK